MLDQGADHEAFARRTFGAVGRFRSGDDRVRIDGGRLRRKKANAAHDVGAIRGSAISFELVRTTTLRFLAAVAMNPRMLVKSASSAGHRRGVRVMATETFVEIGEGLLLIAAESASAAFDESFAREAGSGEKESAPAREPQWDESPRTFRFRLYSANRMRRHE